MSTLLKVSDVKVQFEIKKGQKWPWDPIPKLKAVDGVSFEVNAGETIGVVGESGCGKSTLARALIGLVPVASGTVAFNGVEVDTRDPKAMKDLRKDVQMIFQDPLASLNPRMTVGDIIAEPLRNYYPEWNKEKLLSEVRAMMAKVGLLPNVINRYPHEFSGGQCQRIGIARALILKPKLVICDEPVSALDVSIQAQVVNLLKQLQAEMGLALIFIAHDLSVVRHISDRVMVMYLGNQVETASCEELYANPSHFYSRALLSAVPLPDPEAERNKVVIPLTGELPSPINPPSGCVFRTRCPAVCDDCASKRPELTNIAGTHFVACPRIDAEINVA
ncbi:murein tripeptide/oligopeptide ABC transporter ATP binding protein OppF [Ferrimonas lipolytica]|uniref:Murein tripeptide/oligopeptide ABC transporter ATP binding protein OppF n=1 Tax=Ferrimonas lipolytica TaxID=2724191 RepID=A0A6H1UG37_9GAMM|nr:murein tripeptide/oligopeptide ABC transporter ATP binding protein OppF [Ferrimonas lipolytica]QIZ77788.1 murein tripeptide/oligopeptide ABC transporter ATP binding protein OppF [Ferrimonas lipolytica]